MVALPGVVEEITDKKTALTTINSEVHKMALQPSDQEIEVDPDVVWFRNPF
jgi:hypothetical protein